MRILGIDPGTATTGWGVIEVDNEAVTLVEAGLIETDKKLEAGFRLSEIRRKVDDVIKKHQPTHVAIERLFFAANALTAIAVGQAIGVIKLAVFENNLVPSEYMPMQIKLLIAGSGKADKKKIKQVIKKKFGLKEKKGMRTHFDNTADALAIALCHAKKLLG